MPSGTGVPPTEDELWYSIQVQNEFAGVSAYFEAVGNIDNSGWGVNPIYTYNVILTGGTRTTTSNYISAWKFEFMYGLPYTIMENKYVGIRFSYDNKIYIFRIPTPLQLINQIVVPRDALYIG